MSLETDGPFTGKVVGSQVIAPEVDDSDVSADTGAGNTITVAERKKLKVGFFVQAAGTPYFQTAFACAKAQAESYGWSVDLVDAAVRAAGLEGKVKVYVSGGSPDVVQAMKAGQVQASHPFGPGKAARAAIQMLHEAVAGHPVPYRDRRRRRAARLVLPADRTVLHRSDSRCHRLRSVRAGLGRVREA
ncbi:MAG: hypothetical protein ABWY58_07620 [Aeromicrobium sp.]